MKIAILSDTHGLLRPEVLRALHGSACILHAGDVCSRDVLDRLAEHAPVKAVRGNNDGEWASSLPICLEAEIGGLRVCMAHKRKDLPKDLRPYDLAVSGHTHRYAADWIDHPDRRRTLLLNPGSCGPGRFGLPVTMAVLTVDGGGWTAKQLRIPAARRERSPAPARQDMRRQVEIVMKETQRGTPVGSVAEKYGMDRDLAEQIARLYLTHPGVTADGILSKMGL